MQSYVLSSLEAVAILRDMGHQKYFRKTHHHLHCSAAIWQLHYGRKRRRSQTPHHAAIAMAIEFGCCKILTQAVVLKRDTDLLSKTHEA